MSRSGGHVTGADHREFVMASGLSPNSIAKRRLKRGVFKSVVDLQVVTNRFVANHNQQPKPFVWTADPDKIIAAATRGLQVLDSIR